MNGACYLADESFYNESRKETLLPLRDRSTEQYRWWKYEILNVSEQEVLKQVFFNIIVFAFM